MKKYPFVPPSPCPLVPSNGIMLKLAAKNLVEVKNKL